jgi:osomolarity two-component system, response regulator SSK1
MPVMDGISATKEIRRLEKLNASQGYPGTPQTEGQRTPSDVSNDSRMSLSPCRTSVIIVALTASSLQSDRVAALAAGCNDFLTKPVSLEWLNSKIIEWGSIKALQMFADSRPDFVKSVSAGQAVQAQNIARRLHMPEGRVSPSPSRPLSQPGVVSTVGSGSQPSRSSSDSAPLGKSTPSLLHKSFGTSIPESLKGGTESITGECRDFSVLLHMRKVTDQLASFCGNAKGNAAPPVFHSFP